MTGIVKCEQVGNGFIVETATTKMIAKDIDGVAALLTKDIVSVMKEYSMKVTYVKIQLADKKEELV